LKYQKIPALSGIKLIKLLESDNWVKHGHRAHGVALRKRIGDKTRVTIIPYTKASLPEGTLMMILGRQQTGIGKKGLLKILNR
jgi:predicted RNA binding protein YcfA (HicA-like mRNA interferase family)